MTLRVPQVREGTFSTELFARYQHSEQVLITRDWIEMIFHVDPGRGQSWVEWMIVAAICALTITCGYLARHEWRRASEPAA